MMKTLKKKYVYQFGGNIQGDPKKEEGNEKEVGYNVLDRHGKSALEDSNLDMNDVVSFLTEHGFGSVDEAKRRIVKNIDPYGYSGSYNTLKILANAILKDKPERSKLDNVEEGGRAFKERNDLLALILDQEQPYSSIEESIYRPTIASDGDNSKYYRSEVTEAQIQEAIDNNEDFAEGGLRGDGISDSDYHRLRKNVLGNYKVSVGYDDGKRLPYISYYDVWDLNPFSNWSNTLTTEMEDKLYDAVGLKSPEVYGRVYFDPTKYKHTKYSTPYKSGIDPEQEKELQRLRGL
tara:strand:- start:359 stop:1231 length:873 start_codon:yes stop_codon:yes gene_type:complete